jgi:hypothetical protein
MPRGEIQKKAYEEAQQRPSVTVRPVGEALHLCPGERYRCRPRKRLSRGPEVM